MHVFYIDESYDAHKFVLSAIGVKDSNWKPTFDSIKQLRKDLKTRHGIRLTAEMHARVFVRDCSDGISTKKLSIADRRAIFDEVLTHLAGLKVRIFNICLDVSRFGRLTHLRAIEKMANRIEKAMTAKNSHALVVIDRGKEAQITRLIRKMWAINYIPSRYGRWPSGRSHQSIPITRFIDDPIFKPSRASYFLQMADFAAWALLKRETVPTPFSARWQYENAFQILNPVRYLLASNTDPDGIVRR